MPATDPEDGLPLLTWSELPRRERIVIAVLLIALVAFGIGFYLWIGSAALSAF